VEQNQKNHDYDYPLVSTYALESLYALCAYSRHTVLTVLKIFSLVQIFRGVS
jgi:hypothetical protein